MSLTPEHYQIVTQDDWEQEVLQIVGPFNRRIIRDGVLVRAKKRLANAPRDEYTASRIVDLPEKFP